MNKVDISKELFEEVYTCDITIDKDMFSVYKRVNIYVFAFDCKEWAMNNRYQIISGLSDEPAYRNQDEKAYAKLLWYEGDDIHREYKDMYFMANTEVEAVIKASEYVLKDINEKYSSI